jgi:hypothetical protein
MGGRSQLMGLRDLGSIDIVLEKPPFETVDCKLILVIVDATSDLEEKERLNLLIKKLASYLAYVAGAAFAENYPKVKDSDVIVKVLTVEPPTVDMQLVNAVKSKDGRVRLRVFFEDYHDYMRKVRGVRGGAGPSVN